MSIDRYGENEETALNSDKVGEGEIAHQIDGEDQQ
jgi:hypothetical protein